MIEFAILADHRVKMKESKKIDKYLDLARELKRPWNMKVTVVPIIVGALGTVLLWFEKKLAKVKFETILTKILLKISLNTPKSPGETCCHADSIEKSSAESGVKNSQEVK